MCMLHEHVHVHVHVHAVHMQRPPARRSPTGRGRGASGVAAARLSSIRTPHCCSPPTPTRRRRRRAPPSEPCPRPRPPQPTAAWAGKRCLSAGEGLLRAAGNCWHTVTRDVTCGMWRAPCEPLAWWRVAWWRVATVMQVVWPLFCHPDGLPHDIWHRRIELLSVSLLPRLRHMRGV